MKKPKQKNEQIIDSEQPALQTHFSCSDELCEYMSGLSNGCALLAFSTGKDSIVSWLKMRRYFRRIFPYYLYCVPGNLEFIDKSIRYYEDFFGCHIAQLPHPSLYGFWNEAVFQAPENLRILEEANLYSFTYFEINSMIRSTDDELINAYQATGVRSADSIVRRTSMIKHGQVNHKDMRFFPVFDYKKDDMLRELEAANIALPIDYEWFGRSFDGIDYRFTSVIKENAPDDYDRIVKAFPLVELDILRQQYRAEYHAEEVK